MQGRPDKNRRQGRHWNAGGDSEDANGVGSLRQVVPLEPDSTRNRGGSIKKNKS